MEIPEKIEAEIKRIFSNNIKLMNKLLNLDADAIRFIGREAQYKIDPDVIIKNHESNQDEETYDFALKLKDEYKLYIELCSLYSQKKVENRQNNNSKDQER